MLSTKLLAMAIGFSFSAIFSTFMTVSWWQKQNRQERPIPSARGPLISQLKQRLQHSTANMSVSQYVWLAVISGVIIYVCSAMILQSWWVAIPAFFAGILCAERVMNWRRTQRREKFETGNIRALRIMASSLRTSPSYLLAFEQIANSSFVPAVVKQEYRVVVDMLRSHLPLETALSQLYMRTGSADVLYMATVVTVQRDYGGDMAKTLDLAASAIIRRKQMQRRQKATMSQILAQVNLLSIMPFVFVFALFSHNPHYFQPLTQTMTGRLAMLGCFASILIGGEAIRLIAVSPNRKRRDLS